MGNQSHAQDSNCPSTRSCTATHLQRTFVLVQVARQPAVDMRDDDATSDTKSVRERRVLGRAPSLVPSQYGATSPARQDIPKCTETAIGKMEEIVGYPWFDMESDEKATCM